MSTDQACDSCHSAIEDGEGCQCDGRTVGACCPGDWCVECLADLADQMRAEALEDMW